MEDKARARESADLTTHLRWLLLVVRGARGRDLRALLVDRGLEVGRVMRVRLLMGAVGRHAGHFISLSERCLRSK